MKKVVRKLNRVLSVLLTTAMVVGSVPEAGFTVNAAELGSETETEIQDLDEQDLDDQDTDDAQDPGDRDTDSQDDGDDQATDDQNIGDDQVTDDQDVNDDQDDDSTPDDSNAEEDKESETAPAETSEPVSTEASDDNTAGKEDEVQDDESIAPKDEGEEDGEGEPPAATSGSVSVTKGEGDIKSVKYVFLDVTPEKAYEIGNEVDLTAANPKFGIEEGKDLYILATARDYVTKTVVKADDGVTAKKVDVAGLDSNQVVYKIAEGDVSDGLEISFAVDKEYTITVNKPASGVSVKRIIKSVTGDATVPKESEFKTSLSDSTVKVAYKGTGEEAENTSDILYLYIQADDKYSDIKVTKKAAGETEVSPLQEENGVYTIKDLTKDVTIDISTSAQTTVSVSGDNLTFKYAFAADDTSLSFGDDDVVNNGKIVVTADDLTIGDGDSKKNNNLYIQVTPVGDYRVATVNGTAIAADKIDGTTNAYVHTISNASLKASSEVKFTAEPTKIKVDLPSSGLASSQYIFSKTEPTADSEYKTLATEIEIETEGDLYIKLTGGENASFAADGAIIKSQTGASVKYTGKVSKSSEDKTDNDVLTAKILRSDLAGITELHIALDEESAIVEKSLGSKILLDGEEDLGGTETGVSVKAVKDSAEVELDSKLTLGKSYEFKLDSTEGLAAKGYKLDKVTYTVGKTESQPITPSVAEATKGVYTIPASAVTGDVMINVYIVTATNKVKINTATGVEITQYKNGTDEAIKKGEDAFAATNFTTGIDVSYGKGFTFQFTVDSNEKVKITKSVPKTGDGATGTTNDPIPINEGTADDNLDDYYSVSADNANGIATYTVNTKAASAGEGGITAETTYKIELVANDSKTKFEYETKNAVEGVTDANIEVEITHTKKDVVNNYIGFGKPLEFTITPKDTSMEVIDVKVTKTAKKAEGATGDPTPGDVTLNGDGDTDNTFTPATDEDPAKVKVAAATFGNNSDNNAALIKFTIILAKKTNTVTLAYDNNEDSGTVKGGNLVITQYKTTYGQKEITVPDNTTTPPTTIDDNMTHDVDLDKSMEIIFKVKQPAAAAGGTDTQALAAMSLSELKAAAAEGKVTLPKVTREDSDGTYILPYEKDTTTEGETGYLFFKENTGAISKNTTITFAVEGDEEPNYEVTITGQSDVTGTVEITSDYDEMMVTGPNRQISVTREQDLTFTLKRGRDLAGNMDLTATVKRGAVNLNIKPDENGVYTIDKSLIADGITITISSFEVDTASVAILMKGVSKDAFNAVEIKTDEDSIETAYLQYKVIGRDEDYYKAVTEGQIGKDLVLYNEAVVGKSFELRFRADRNYQVSVAQGSGDSATALTAEKDGLDSVYTIPVTDTKRIELTVKAEDVTPRAMICFDNTKVSVVSAMAGAKKININDIADGTETEDVTTTDADGKEVKTTKTYNRYRLDSADDALTVTFKGKDGYLIKGANKTTNELTVTVKAGAKADVETESGYTVTVKVGTNEVAPENGKYNVDYTGSVIIGLKNGSASPAVKAVAAKAGKTALSETEAKISGSNAEIVMDKKFAGKTITVDLSAEVTVKATEEGKQDTTEVQKVATVTLVVNPELKGLTVTGVKNSAATQTAGTVKTYAVTVNPKTAAASLYADSDNKTAVDAKIVDGALVIDAKAVAAPATAKITVWAGAEKLENAAVSTEFTLTTAAGVTDKKTTAKVKYAHDTGFTLTLGAAALPELDNGGYYYKVEAKKGQAAEGITANDKTVYVPVTGASQDAKIDGLVNKDSKGNGGVASFDITVTLVQAATSGTTQVATLANIVGENTAKAVKLAGISTKNPYYETALKVKSGGTVYTGQADAVIAIPQFSKDTTYTGNLKVSVISTTARYPIPTTEWDDGEYVNLYKLNENNQITLNIPQDGDYVGKHTFKITAETVMENVIGDTMYAASATVTVNVVRGIDQLDLSAPETLYKADKKAASVTVKPVYNGGLSADKPKAAKVKDWKIVNKVTKQADPKVTISKSGKITVAKDYVLTGNDTFVVTAYAADYNGNYVSRRIGRAEIQITNQKANIAQVVIAGLGYDDKDNYGYRIITGGDVEPNDISGWVWVYALKNTAPASGFINYADWDSYVLPGVSFKSSNAKALEVTETGRILVKKPANNITITATANDGSKSKQTMKLNVKYAAVDDLGIQFYENEYRYYNGQEINQYATPNDTNVSFLGTTASKFELKVKQYDSESKQWVNLDDFTDFKVTVKGAKLLKYTTGKTVAGTYGERCMFVATGKTATVTLKYGSSTKTYTLTNTGFEAANKVAAPKITLNPKSVKTNEAIHIRATVGPVKNHTYADEQLFAQVEVDETAVNAGNSLAYSVLRDSLGEWPLNNVDAKGNSYIDMDSYMGRGIPTTGSYKLKLTVGTKNVNGQFEPIAKAANITIKVTKGATAAKELKLKMSLRDAGVTLPVRYDKVLNANINGQPNAFRDYFELETATTENGSSYFTGRLKLTANAFKTDNKLSDNLVGYLRYGSIDTKVTITLVDTATTKYTADTLNLISGAVDVNVPIYSGKNKVSIMAAKEDAGSALAAKVVLPTGAVAGNTAVQSINLSGTVEKGNYKVIVWVVPDDSNDVIAGKAADAVKDPAAYGIPVTINVKVSDAETTKNKVKFGASKYTFTMASQHAAAFQSGYDRENRGYWIDMPYTLTSANTLIKEVKNVSDKDKEKLIDVTYDEKTGIISAWVGNDSLATLGYSGKKAVSYKVPVEITYANSSKTDSVNLTFVMPTEPVTDYNAAMDALEAARETIEKAVVPQIGRAQITTIYDDYDNPIDNVMIGNYCPWELDAINQAVENLKSRIFAEINNNADVLIETDEVAWDDKTNNWSATQTWLGANYMQPTAAAVGTLTVNAKIYDMTQAVVTNGKVTSKPVFTEMSFTLTIPKLTAVPADLSGFVSRWIDSYGDLQVPVGTDGRPVMTLTKNTTLEELQTAIRSDLSAWNVVEDQPDGRKYDLTNIRVNVTEYAPVGGDLYNVEGTIVIKDVVSGRESNNGFGYEFTKENFDMEELLNKSVNVNEKGTVTKIIEALDMTTKISKDTSSADIKAFVEAGLNNDDIIVDADKTTVTLTEAAANAADKSGTLTIRLVLRQKSTNKILRQTYEDIHYPDADAAAAFAKGSVINADWVKAEVAKLRAVKVDYNDADLKSALENAANALLSDAEKAKYQFKFLEDDFVVAKLPEATAAGSISRFKLSLVTVSLATESYIKEPITIAGPIELEAEIARQTLATTENAILGATQNNSEFIVTNNTSESEVLQAATAAVDTSRFTVAYQQVIFDKDGKPTDRTGDAVQPDTEKGETKGDYFVKTEATVNAKGEIKAVFEVTEKNPAQGATPESKPVSVIMKIDESSQTDAQAYAAAKKAIDDLASEELTKDKVLAAATAAVKSPTYTVAEGKLDFKAATATEDGSIKGTVNIKKGSNTIRVITVDKVVKPKAATPTT